MRFVRFQNNYLDRPERNRVIFSCIVFILRCALYAHNRITIVFLLSCVVSIVLLFCLHMSSTHNRYTGSCSATFYPAMICFSTGQFAETYLTRGLGGEQHPPFSSRPVKCVDGATAGMQNNIAYNEQRMFEIKKCLCILYLMIWAASQKRTATRWISTHLSWA